MRIETYEIKEVAAGATADHGASLLLMELTRCETVNLVVAADLAQADVLEHPRCATMIGWNRAAVFHFDEYLGLPIAHPTSCRKFVQENFVNHLPSLCSFHSVNGDAYNAKSETLRLNDLLKGVEPHVCFAGIEESGHLEFNEPPANLVTQQSKIESVQRCAMPQKGL
jgi:glucosamine-6-phosphate deaminase